MSKYIMGLLFNALCQSGPNILVAAMRCYVASKLGDSVYIPKGLLK